MKKRFAELIDVKSIVTICLTLVFSVLALCGVINSQSFLTIYTTVIAFYFGTQYAKKKNKTETQDQDEPESK